MWSKVMLRHVTFSSELDCFIHLLHLVLLVKPSHSPQEKSPPISTEGKLSYAAPEQALICNPGTSLVICSPWEKYVDKTPSISPSHLKLDSLVLVTSTDLPSIITLPPFQTVPHTSPRIFILVHNGFYILTVLHSEPGFYILTGFYSHVTLT
jgi:hypothetical protein